MSDYVKKFVVKGPVKLSKCDPAYTGKESKEEALETTKKYLAKTDEQQLLLYAQQKHSLLIVLQGLDAAGKDGTVRHLMSGTNPQGCVVSNFKQPTPEEKAHDFLWRVHPHVPAKGMVGLFNRSHYEDVLVARVHNLVPKKQWAKRYDNINEFEALLVEQNNTTILKFFLHISKEEQLERFKKRLEDPKCNWKISESDYTERNYWDEYTEAYEEALAKTSTSHAPWFVIPADKKWFRNRAVSEIVCKTLEGMNLAFPVPTIDLKDIQKKYKTQVRVEKNTTLH